MIGGGMTAAAAVDGIREADPTGSIGVFSMEADPPYNRPPLSKGLWKGDPEEGIWRKPKGDAPELHLNHEIKEIIPKERRATDSQGNVFTYKTLLLATGGTPRRLPFDDDQIIYFRTLADYRRLRVLTEKGERFAVVGGGFIGSEIAAALAMNGVAAFCNPALQKRMRVEHEDNANTMGRAAGRNMAGKREPYDYLPFFYSDLFELGYEAVGEVGSRLETFADWKRPNEEGVIYYLKDGRVRGLLLWNVWGQVEAARQFNRGTRAVHRRKPERAPAGHKFLEGVR